MCVPMKQTGRFMSGSHRYTAPRLCHFKQPETPTRRVSSQNLSRKSVRALNSCGVSTEATWHREQLSTFSCSLSKKPKMDPFLSKPSEMWHELHVLQYYIMNWKANFEGQESCVLRHYVIRETTPRLDSHIDLMWPEAKNKRLECQLACWRANGTNH